MNLKIDREADALYLRLDKARVIESEQVAPGVIVDFDARNRVVGVEVLALSKRLPRAAPTKATSPAKEPAAALVREKRARYGR